MEISSVGGIGEAMLRANDEGTGCLTTGTGAVSH